MKKFLLLFSFLLVSMTMYSCRQNEDILSNDDVTNLRIIQNTRSNRLSNQLNNTTKRDSTTVTFKQDELVKPPK